jgi:hypothetical protein
MRVSLVITALLTTASACAVDPSAGDDIADDEGKADGIGGKLRPVTAADRREYLAQAVIWQPTDVATMDLRRGPLGAVGYEADPPQSMPCRFVEPEEEIPGGKSPKFLCERALDQKVVKVKYSRDELDVNRSLDVNGEVYGEALGTRLFWALGFFADRNFTTKTFCQNCPSGDPFSVYSGAQQSRLALREFRNTLIEDKLAGKKIEECTKLAASDPSKCEQTVEDQGWSWDELVTHSRASRVEIDALRLLAAFVQHADNKAANQRLLCTEVAADGRCARSVAFAQDLGTTFGARTLFSYDKAKLSAWQGVAVWKDPAKCQANLSIHASGTLSNPIVTEAARAFLADLLMQLTDAQIEDLFRGSRVDHRDPSITDEAQRNAIIAQWVAAFKDKRAQLVNHTCPQ